MKLISILLFLISFSAFSSIDLTCNDQNSHAVYSLKILDNSKIKLSPLLKDQSPLSYSNTSLRYNEGESSGELQLFEGKNSASLIVLELNISQAKQLTPFLTIDVLAYYTDEDINILNKKTVLICSLN
jgi:hypothetical protein